MTLREVRRDEIPALRALSVATFTAAFGDQNTPEDMQLYLSEKMGLEHLTSEYDHPDSSFYFALTNDEIVGYLKLNSGDAQSERLPGNSLELERIYVTKTHQSNGIGQAIFESVIKMARARGFEVLWLGVWEHNLRAISFYQRMGMEVFGTHPFMLGNDRQMDKLMKMHL